MAQQSADQMLQDKDRHYMSIIEDLMGKLKMKDSSFTASPSQYKHVHEPLQKAPSGLDPPKVNVSPHMRDESPIIQPR